MSKSSAGEGSSAKAKAGPSQPAETSFKRKRGVFQKELQHMMYGFGDDPNPLPESVALMEDIVVEYITDLVHKAQDTGSNRGKLSVEDFLYLIRKPSQNAGAFVNGIFGWLGKEIRDNSVFYAIILYNGYNEDFDFMELPYGLNGPGLKLANLGEDVAGLWEEGRNNCIWLVNFENKSFKTIEISRYYHSGTVFEPLCFYHETSSLLLLVMNEGLELYDLGNDDIRNQFHDFPLNAFN